jgi:hypothetical protein
MKVVFTPAADADLDDVLTTPLKTIPRSVYRLNSAFALCLFELSNGRRARAKWANGLARGLYR